MRCCLQQCSVSGTRHWQLGDCGILPSMVHHPALLSERTTFIFCKCLCWGPLLRPLSFASQAFVYSFFPWECLRLNNRKPSPPQRCSWTTLKAWRFIPVRIITAVFLSRKALHVFKYRMTVYALNCYRIIRTNIYWASQHLAIWPWLSCSSYTLPLRWRNCPCAFYSALQTLEGKQT